MDEGGPASRHLLSMAPDPIRCQRMVARKDGTTGRCSRFGILLPDGTRDSFCVAHSPTRHASRVRRTGARAQRAAEQADRRHREWIMNEVAPEPIQTVEDLRLARHVLKRLLIAGELTVAEVRELRAIVDADEATMLRSPGEYHT